MEFIIFKIAFVTIAVAEHYFTLFKINIELAFLY